MPHNANEEIKKKDAADQVEQEAVGAAASKPAKKKSVKAEGESSAKKSTSSKNTGKKKSGKKTGRKKRRQKTPWWCAPVIAVSVLVLLAAGMLVSKENKQYEEFKAMRETVSFEGFYPGVVIEGVSVGGRQLNEVLLSLRAHEEGIEQQINVTLVSDDKVWNITAEDLGYNTDYEEIVRSAYQAGREGSVRERYDAIAALSQSGAEFTITRGYDVSMLRTITDGIAAELSYAAVDAMVSDFDVATQDFKFTESTQGKYVDAEALYQSAVTALNSGVGGQTVVVSRETVEPAVTKADLQQNFGKITEARTNASNSNKNRLTNIRLALETLNGVMIRPGETFSFNGVVGERTSARGYKKAGAFVDGMVSEELGGGICQVSTTLFNAVAKADLEIVERQPHSRPVGYVDKGKDAAVSWPSQDFKFTNNTDYPVYIVTDMGDTDDRCIISLYGRKLPDGMSIIVEAETTETIKPEDPRYIYTSSLPTGQKELIEEARDGYRAVAHKIYLDANGKEIRREVLCYSKYNAAGAVYRVGQ